jgi:hypothetical protein
VYTHYDRLFNFFYASRKLVCKERTGSKVRRTYYKPQTPFERAIVSADTSEEKMSYIFEETVKSYGRDETNAVSS